MENDHKALSQAIANHVLRILETQDQLRACELAIRELKDTLVYQESQKRLLTDNIHELQDVLDYSISNHQDPTQILLTLTRQEVVGSARHTHQEQPTTCDEFDF